MTATVSSGDVIALKADLTRLRDDIKKRMDSVVRHHGQLLVTKVKAHASGRPGPNAPTGDYRRSITMRMYRTPASATAYVGTNKPQGRRLEFGFVGTDSLGRNYNQQPYPHFGPALDEIAEPFSDAMKGVL